MASANPLKDLTENFLLCSVCLNHFKEPKLLPCLHRYCRDCLNKVIQANQDGTIKCPLCQQVSVIPENGVDGFKTDFYMKSMQEFIISQNSSENENVKQGVSCSGNTKVQTGFKDNVTIAQQESVIDIAGKATKFWSLGITNSGDGNIVVSGMTSKGIPHITVVNWTGEIHRQDHFKNDTDIAWRFCCPLSEFKVITADNSNIGIYDVRNGAFGIKINIPDVITNQQPFRPVSCITIDPVKSHIIVGTYSRYLYVFTDQLHYSHILTLPDVIDGVMYITAHSGNLIVCCNDRAYAATTKEPLSELMYEFTKPDIDKCNWSPRSVCTDKNEFIYMLWCTRSSHQRRCILVQYSQNGRQVLTRKVDDNASCVTTMEKDGKEKLVLSASGKLYKYGLLVT